MPFFPAKWPKSQLKLSKKIPEIEIFLDFCDFLIDFKGHFSGGVKMALFGL